MSLTPSTMLPLGTPAVDFRLPDVITGKTVSLKDFDNKKVNYSFDFGLDSENSQVAFPTEKYLQLMNLKGSFLKQS